MQENRVHRGRSSQRAKRRDQLLIKLYAILGVVMVVVIGVIVFCTAVAIRNNATPAEPVEITPIVYEVTNTVATTAIVEETEAITEDITALAKETEVTEETTEETAETEAPTTLVEDPNNDVYPYSLMSIDCWEEIYEQGWRYYELPSSYSQYGGMFPEVAQAYLWNLCRDAGVDYYTVLALIEMESGYKCGNTGDSGNSKGLMQIQERWHRERMERLDATDLYNPYDNMRVGVDYLAEIQRRYSNSGEHCVLMVYNMGDTVAKSLWDQGCYSTGYSRYILSRAQEIKQELQDS